MLDVSDIKQIRLIAELGSISKAAELLHMSQPTLSKRISRLETLLGIALFHRSNSGMLATEAATYIMHEGEKLDRQIGAIERHIELMATVQGGVINLGVGPIVEQLYFPFVLLEYSRRFPRIRVMLRTGDSRQLMSWLREGQIDVAAGPFEDELSTTELYAEPLDQDAVILVVRRGHPLEGKKSLTIQDVEAYPSIGPYLPPRLTEALGLGAAFTLNVLCDNYSTSKSLVLASDYVTGGPERLFATELAANTLVRLPMALDMSWSAHFLTRAESIRLPAIQQLLNVFLERAG